jgi:hypothetical protein
MAIIVTIFNYCEAQITYKKPHFVFEEVHAGYNQKISEHTEVVTNLLFVSVCFTLVVT